MEFQAEIDQATPAWWHEQMALFEDANLYQTWSYGSIRWGAKNLSRLVLRRKGEVVAMAQVRIIRSRFAPGGVAYLRWGPMCQLRGRGLEPETARAMASALREEYVKKRRLFLRVLPNAFAGSERARVFATVFPQFKQTALTASNTDRTFLLDITPSREEIRKKLDGKWRNHLNRAEKNELTIIEGSGPAEYKRFLQVYEMMWSRKQFETTVDVNEFARINEDLPEKLRFKILICEHAGQPVSAVVCSAMGHTGIYVLGATHGEGLQTRAAYLIHWTMINRLKEMGIQYYDLGGINPETNPGVYQFKRGFSGEDVTRIAPLECCEDLISSVGMRAADFARNDVRGFVGKLKKKLAGSVSSLKPVEKKAEATPTQLNP